MTATLADKNEVTNYTFNIEHEGNTYEAIVYVKDGKFYDDQIFLDGEELDYEGEEGEIRESIMSYIDKNWNKLTE